MHDTALTEIKALLTLALLKSGTSARDIQTAIDIAATTRLMAGEESAGLDDDDRNIIESNVTNIRDPRYGSAVMPREGKRQAPISGLNGDVKALLSLLLLQHGATSKEILTTLRMAATAHVQDDERDCESELDELAEAAARITEKAQVVQRPQSRPAETAAAPKQRLRNEYLPPIDRSTRAA
jgi:hypothetical protein